MFSIFELPWWPCLLLILPMDCLIWPPTLTHFTSWQSTIHQWRWTQQYPPIPTTPATPISHYLGNPFPAPIFSENLVKYHWESSNWPFVIRDYMIVAYYPIFLYNLPLLLTHNIPLQTQLRMWLQHDGAPSHVGWQVTVCLISIILIARLTVLVDKPCGGATHLTSLNHFLWGTWRTYSTSRYHRQEKNWWCWPSEMFCCIMELPYPIASKKCIFFVFKVWGILELEPWR